MRNTIVIISYLVILLVTLLHQPDIAAVVLAVVVGFVYIAFNDMLDEYDATTIKRLNARKHPTHGIYVTTNPLGPIPMVESRTIPCVQSKAVDSEVLMKYQYLQRHTKAHTHLFIGIHVNIVIVLVVAILVEYLSRKTGYVLIATGLTYVLANTTTYTRDRWNIIIKLLKEWDEHSR